MYALAWVITTNLSTVESKELLLGERGSWEEGRRGKGKGKEEEERDGGGRRESDE